MMPDKRTGVRNRYLKRMPQHDALDSRDSVYQFSQTGGKNAMPTIRDDDLEMDESAVDSAAVPAGAGNEPAASANGCTRVRRKKEIEYPECGVCGQNRPE